MQVDYAKEYRNLSERHWWWRAREAFVLSRLARLRRLEPDPTPWRILDVGCGAGVWFDRLKRHGEVKGLEPIAELANTSPYRDRIQIGRLNADFRAEEPCDLILLLDVLEHLDDDLGALRALARSLRPNGRIILTVPALPWLWSEHDEINEHKRRYVSASLRSTLSAAGFDVEELYYFYHWTVAPMLVRRLLRPSGATGSAHIPTIPPRPVNLALTLLSRLDLSLAPLRIPLGSSLYASARIRR